MIVLLILAVLVLGAFVAWEYLIEKRGRTPPLLPLGVFTLDHGRVSILCLVAVSHAKIAIREGPFAHVSACDHAALQLYRFLGLYALDHIIFPGIPRTLSQGYSRKSRCLSNQK
jgi:hypothetical protein